MPSLVGSEMCIRARSSSVVFLPIRTALSAPGTRPAIANEKISQSVGPRVFRDWEGSSYGGNSITVVTVSRVSSRGNASRGTNRPFGKDEYAQSGTGEGGARSGGKFRTS